jgi:hypothetical protein
MIASIINISDLCFDTPFKSASSILSIVALALLFIATVIEIFVIRAHKGNYQLEEFTKSYGGMVEGLNQDSIIGRYWNPLNLFRWAVTIVILVFLNKHSFAQILALFVVSVFFQLLMVIGHPMADKWDHRITWIIEVSVSIYLYVLLTLTDFSDEKTLREEKGWVLTILTGTVVAINVLIFIWKGFWRAVASFKQRFGLIFV